MLELTNIKKNYAEGDNTVRALRGISLQFRKSEFVSILGPSGCGKTTMLNIIGGLDQYTEGDLVINGISTRNYKDRDWDTYRNHSIGFVFQSYNLIPHQSVLQNVELALSLSGVKKRERRERAKRALIQVGLGDQLKKRPAEMSGGQMQRVAIARALVNDPEIILADEPTGALDTETSLQVMRILKEISKERLVIMVTHNPELAETYSTRIIRMLDGKITDDSAPLSREELDACRKEDAAQRSTKREKKPSMSFATSFGLSLKNLFTKKGRTTLTAFAGSIGIIGIALIFAVSQGTTNYIDLLQEDTLASYPLTIEASTIDVSTLMTTFMGTAAEEEEAHPEGSVYSQAVLYEMINALNNIESTENDLKAFKEYLDEAIADEEHPLHGALTGVQYSYDLDLTVYTKSVDGTIVASDTEELLMELIADNMGMDLSAMTSMGGDSTMGSMMDMGMSMSPMSAAANLWTEMLPGENGKLYNDILENQYDLVYGNWPTKYNEILLIVDKNSELDDLTLYALGLEPKEEVTEIFNAVMNGEELVTEQKSWAYEEICGLDLRVILASDCYTWDEAAETYTDLRETQAGMRYLYDNGLDLTITGIITPSEDATSAMLSGSVAYTSALTEYIIEAAQNSEVVEAQLADADTDVFTGLPFDTSTSSTTDAEKAAEFAAYLDTLTTYEKAAVYVSIISIPSQEQLDAAAAQAMAGMTREQMQETMIQALAGQTGMNQDQILAYVAEMSDEEFTELYTQMVYEQVTMQMEAQVQQQMSMMEPEALAAALDEASESFTEEQRALYRDEIMQFADGTYEENLIRLGCVYLDSPTAVNLFAASFEDKDIIEEAIAAYNEDVEELKQIHYTDYVGIMMSSVTSIINAVTYVLIAFVAISLVVSSIMIGVITLISVQERTKEIGILRAIGASKQNVSSMFNAETVIIGAASGILGIGITYFLCLPINAIIQHFTGIATLKAVLPTEVAVALVVISVLLTLISGIIPSRSAAKKDPVVALRTE